MTHHSIRHHAALALALCTTLAGVAQAAGAHQLRAPARLSSKAMLDAFEQPVLLGRRRAAANGRQQHGGDHGHPAYPQHHAQHMQGAGNGVYIPFHHSSGLSGAGIPAP